MWWERPLYCLLWSLGWAALACAGSESDCAGSRFPCPGVSQVPVRGPPPRRGWLARTGLVWAHEVPLSQGERATILGVTRRARTGWGGGCEEPWGSEPFRLLSLGVPPVVGVVAGLGSGSAALGQQVAQRLRSLPWQCLLPLYCWWLQKICTLL